MVFAIFVALLLLVIIFGGLIAGFMLLMEYLKTRAEKERENLKG